MRSLNMCVVCVLQGHTRHINTRHHTMLFSDGGWGRMAPRQKGVHCKFFSPRKQSGEQYATVVDSFRDGSEVPTEKAQGALDLVHSPVDQRGGYRIC